MLRFLAPGKVCLGLILIAGFCFAQFSSSVQGLVEDPSGGAVPNARVTLINTATNITQTATADAAGNYRFVSLAPGSYTLTAEAPGFSKGTISATLEANQNTNVPIKMSVSSASTTVEVTGAAPVINTADSRNQQTLNTQTLASLPLAGRSMIGLVTQAPGVTGRGLAAYSSPGSAVDNYSTEQQVDASANGRSSNANMYIVDGLDITSNIRPGVLNLSPNPDTIQEGTTAVNTYSSEYGRGSSIVFTMTTKSGADQFHGLASDYYQYQDFFAGTEFQHNYSPFHSNNVSGNLGGPIIPHHQFFFFVGAEPLRSTSPSGNSVITYEDQAFTRFAQQNFPNTVGTQLLTQFPASGATTTSVNQTALQLFPNTCGTAASAFLPCNTPVVDNGFFNSTNTRNALQWNVRIDKYWKNDRLYGSFYRTTLNTSTSNPRPTFGTSDQYTTNSFQVNETHTFSPTVINEGAFSFLRIEGIAPATGNFAVPVVSVTGLGQGFGNGFALGDFIQHSYHWRDVLTSIQGAHTIRVGYDGWHGDDTALFASTHDQPNFQFNNLLDLVQDQPYNETMVAYDPLTGQHAQGSYGYSETTFGLFFEDSWKIRPNFTLNYGLRWDDYGNPYPSLAGTNLSNFFLGQGGTFNDRVANGAMRKVSNVYDGRLNKNWAPRFGIAWDPTNNGNWVIRGGFGMYHDMPTLGNAVDGLNTNPPGYITPTFFNDGTTARPVFGFGTTNEPPFGFVYPSIPGSTIDSRGGIVGLQNSVGGLSPTLTAPTTFNYSLAVEHKIFGNITASAGYSGSRSFDILSGYGQTGNTSYGIDINRFSGDLLLHPGNTSPTRLNPSFGAINYSQNAADARYDAAIFDVRGRYSRFGYFDASYTRSKAEDSSQAYPIYGNLSRFYGPSAWDAPNRFSGTFNFDIPGYHNNTGALGRTLSGWSLSGTISLQSGNPVNVYTNASFANGGDYNADGVNFDFPDVASYQQGDDKRAFLNGIFQPGNFTAPTPGGLGNERYNRFRNQNFKEFDASLIKNTRIFERLNLQLRFEVYNVLNRVNLNGINSNLSDANFGKSTSQANPRNLQVGAKITF